MRPPGPGPTSNTVTPASSPAARRDACGEIEIEQEILSERFSGDETVAANDLAQWRQAVRRGGHDAASGAGLSAMASRAASRSAATRLVAIGGAGAGDVEGGAVIGRGAHERKAERDIDGVIESKRLDRDQRLVVIHAQGGIVGRARPFVEQRIGRQRTPGIDAVGNEPRNGRGNDGAVLLAERAVLAGVGVEPGDGEPRARNAKPHGKIARHDASGFDHEFGRKMLEDFPQRQMDRHRHDGKFRRP